MSNRRFYKNYFIGASFSVEILVFFLKNAVQMIQIEIESAENASADSKTEKQHQRHFSWYSLETAGSGPDLLTL